MYKKYITQAAFLTAFLLFPLHAAQANNDDVITWFELDKEASSKRKITIDEDISSAPDIKTDDNFSDLGFEDVAAKDEVGVKNTLPQIKPEATSNISLVATQGSSLSGSAASLKNDYHILPGDILHINVWKEEEMSREVLVLPDGVITFPLVGSLYVRGMTPQEAQTAIEEKLINTVPDTPVTVSVTSPAGHSVNVIGQVIEPGAVIMRGNMSVMQVLSEVGGLTPYADKGDILVIRTYDNGDKESIDIPYKSIMKGKKLDKDIRLIPGDVIVVPTAGLF